MSRYLLSILVLSVSLIAAASSADPALQGLDNPRQSLLDASVQLTPTRPLSEFAPYLDGLFAAQFNDLKLAGATVSLIHNGELALLKGYGYADLASFTKVDPMRHLFRPGSVSKLFTWTAVMQLVEQGKLDLSADIGTYVPQFKLPNAFDKPLTLTHLLTHTPGLEDGAAGYLIGDEPEDLIGLAEALERYMPTQVREPGTYASYSNWATSLAGLIVANVSGVPFEQYIADNILAPLDMQQATFEEPLPAHLIDDMTTGYVLQDNALAPFPFEYIKNFGPAGAMSASAGAITQFMLAHLHQGRVGNTTILQPDTLALMHSKLQSHHNRVDAMAHGFYETNRNDTRFIGHDGATIAFHSQLILDPERGFGFFVSFNSGPGAEARGAIVNGVLDYFYPPKPMTLPTEQLAGTDERIAKVAGAYRVNRRSFTQLEGVIALAGDISITPLEDGAIAMTLPDGGGKFVEVEPWVFQQVDRQQRLAFQTDGNTNVTHLFIGSAPIMVGDRMSWWEQASNHQMVIALVLISALFTVINTLRNVRRPLVGAAFWGRVSTTAAAMSYLMFVVLLAVALSGLDMDRAVFDFPPSGTGLALLAAMVGVIFTGIAAVLLVPVWRDRDCVGGARWRYLWLVIVFTLFALVLNYWNLLGWKY